MNSPRRAAPRWYILLTSLMAGLGALVTMVACLAAVLSARVARRVVTPAVRVADVSVEAVDPKAQTITLAETPDTTLPGRYGLFTGGTESYVKIGAVLNSADGLVTRKLLTKVGRTSRISEHAAFSGWYFTDAAELRRPFEEVSVGTPVGRAPAWFFPAATEDRSRGTVVAVHGRGTQRQEVLRAVPVLTDAGYDVLAVSYRNDGDAPRSASGRYGLGATEWYDIDAAIGWAVARGADDILLMGWSMGGAIVLQSALNGVWRDHIRGILLESPVTDWRLVLGFQARELHVPSTITHMAMAALNRTWSSRVIRGGDPISLNELDVVARAGELEHPILILHSDDDGFVPSDGSHRLADARPDLVTMETFTTARHTKLWNYDEARWEGAIASWLDRLTVPSTSITSAGAN